MKKITTFLLSVLVVIFYSGCWDSYGSFSFSIESNDSTLKIGDTIAIDIAITNLSYTKEKLTYKEELTNFRFNINNAKQCRDTLDLSHNIVIYDDWRSLNERNTKRKKLFFKPFERKKITTKCKLYKSTNQTVTLILIDFKRAYTLEIESLKKCNLITIHCLAEPINPSMFDSLEDYAKPLQLTLTDF